MYLDVHKHITTCIANSTIEKDPYPHMVVDGFFPDFFYKQILANSFPDDFLINLKEFSKRVGQGYSDSRHVLHLKSNMPYLDPELRQFWENLAKYIKNHFFNLILQKYKVPNINLLADFLYVRDTADFSLGPHTDKKQKVLTCLMYLPNDTSLSKYGTTIYTAKDPDFTCIGGPHHKRDQFNIYRTVEFIPNRMFCFLKSDRSFHGVEPVNENISRNLLIFDIQKT